jgi:hypothetical protein
MKSLCSRETFSTEFGSFEEEATQVFTEIYKFLTITDSYVYFNFDLSSIFSEHIELFSVDSSLTSDIFIINKIFSDETITPEIIMIMTDLIENAFQSDIEPIHEDGYFWLPFTELRSWYGEDQFDERMNLLYPKDYDAFKEYFLE